MASFADADITLTKALERSEFYRTRYGELLIYREMLAKIVGAFTSGVYCLNCGTSVDDCDCIISQCRQLLEDVP